MKLSQIFEQQLPSKLPVYRIKDEDEWYSATQETEEDRIPTSSPGLRLIGIILAGGYRDGLPGEHLYSKDGKLYAEDVLNYPGEAIPISLTIFQLRQLLNQVGQDYM